MTIRTAVTVTLALAVLGAALPAVEDARRSHANSRVLDAIDRLDRVASGLAAENEVVRGRPARTRVTLVLPRASWGTSGLSTFSIPARGVGHDVTWRIAGGPARSTHLSVRLVGAGDGVSLDAGGRHRLVLELRQDDGERAVVVRKSAAEVTPT